MLYHYFHELYAACNLLLTNIQKWDFSVTRLPRQPQSIFYNAYVQTLGLSMFVPFS